MLQESVASELGARMAAMQSASDNAEDLADRLSIIYNRARQSAITNEICEIVAGASSVEGGGGEQVCIYIHTHTYMRRKFERRVFD